MSLPSSMADFVPRDRLLQKAYYLFLCRSLQNNNHILHIREIHRLNIKSLFNLRCLKRCCLNCLLLLERQLASVCIFNHQSVWAFVWFALAFLVISLPFIQLLLFVQGRHLSLIKLLLSFDDETPFVKESISRA